MRAAGLRQAAAGTLQCQGHGALAFGPQYFFCNAPVKVVGDLKGLKVRSYTPSMTALVQHLGAIPVTLPISEVYPALQRGLVTCGITSAVSAYAGKWAKVTQRMSCRCRCRGVQGHFMSLGGLGNASPRISRRR